MKDHGATYLSGEMIHEKVTLPSATGRGYQYHLYVSPTNAGAVQFLEEINGWLAARQEASEHEKLKRRRKHHHLHHKETSTTRSSMALMKKRSMGSMRAVGSMRSVTGPSGAGGDDAQEVQFTQSFAELDQCEAMLCYLNGKTWTSGETR